MKLRQFETQVAAGCLTILILQALRHGSPQTADRAVQQMLEAAGFVLCCTGVIAGGRRIRLEYQALGSNQSVAVTRPDYMRQRRRVQVAALMASAAVGSLAASRFGLNPLYSALVVFAGLAIAIPLINRLTGWNSGNRSRS